MNGVHMPYETLLRPSELYTCKSTAFNRTYFDFSTKAIKADISMRPKRTEITTGPAKRKTGSGTPGPTARILLIASAGSVNGQPASNEKRT